MKKILLTAPLILLFAAACNSTPAAPTTASQPQQTDTQTYKYLPYNFQFNYPTEFGFVTPSYANLDEKIVQLQLPNSTYPGTNFGDADFSVSDTFTNSLAKCLALPSNTASGQGFQTKQTINGTDFYYATGSDAGAGNLYQSKIYRTLQKSFCFEIDETIHTSNIGNYTPGTVTEVNTDPIWQKLDTILNTFTFNK